MKILVTGATGLVGSHFVEKTGINPDFELLTPTAHELDITSKTAVNIYINKNKPDSIIHFAAYTDVSAAEDQRGNKEGSCWIINVEGTRNIAQAAQKIGSYFIHISTDVVFSGKKDDPGPYKENHPVKTGVDETSWYGWTKAQAEHIVKESLSNLAIVRITCPTRARFDPKLDYVRKILKAYDMGKSISLFSDQHTTLTHINLATESLRKLLHNRFRGIFHISSTDNFTPFELGTYLLKKARGANNVVKPSSIKDYFKITGNSTRYPQHGGLDPQYTQRKLAIPFATWREVIDKLIMEGIVV